MTPIPSVQNAPAAAPPGLPGDPFTEVTVDAVGRREVIRWLGGLAHKDILWVWQYPEDIPQRYVALRDQQGDLVGFNGMMPVRIRSAGKEFDAAWSCDFVVAPEHRGSGVGKALKQRLMTSSPVLMAFGITDQAVPVHRRMGWFETDTEIFRMVKNQTGWTLRSLARRSLQRGRALVFKLLSWPRARRFQAARVHSILVDDTVAVTLAHLWERKATDWGVCVVRDEHYLTWRYARCPGIHYQALVLEDAGGEPRAAFIYRTHPWTACLVDYLGARDDLQAKVVLLDEFMQRFEHTPVIECSTSDEQLRRLLAHHGFLREQGIAERFHVAAPGLPDAQAIAGRWMLFAGDSDGDFLAAAHLQPQVRVRQWSEEEFLVAEEAWQCLLERSDAHRLFMSWQWQSQWWRCFAGEGAAELKVMAAYDADDVLMGVAGFVLERVRTRYGREVRRLRTLGSLWGGGYGMRTEHQAFVLQRGAENSVVAAIMTFLRNCGDWQDLVLDDVEIGTPFHAAVAQFGSRIGRFRQPNAAYDSSYQVDTRGDFEAYKASLSQSARRRLFGLRRRLEHQYGPIEIQYAGEDQVEAYLADLNRLHAKRWGNHVFVGAKLDFNQCIARWRAKSSELRLSRLLVAGETRSVLFNVRVGDEEVNLQAGFDDAFDRRLPLGYLHIGYAIESCFQDGMRALNLLAGWGKHTDYKAALATRRVPLSTLHVVRSPMLAAGYYLRDRYFSRAERG